VEAPWRRDRANTERSGKVEIGTRGQVDFAEEVEVVGTGKESEGGGRVKG